MQSKMVTMSIKSKMYRSDNALPNAINSVQAVMTDIVPMIYNAGMSIISWIINIILAFVISCHFHN